MGKFLNSYGRSSCGISAPAAWSDPFFQRYARVRHHHTTASGRNRSDRRARSRSKTAAAVASFVNFLPKCPLKMPLPRQCSHSNASYPCPSHSRHPTPQQEMHSRTTIPSPLQCGQVFLFYCSASCCAACAYSTTLLFIGSDLSRLLRVLSPCPQ